MASKKCSKCGHENPPGARFCVSCGSSLSEPGNESPRDITEEIRQLRSLLTQVNNRLDSLEQRQGFVPPEAPPPVAEAPPAPAKPAPTAAAPPPEKKPPVPKKEREWEQILGGSWLARIGVLALIVGAGFFLKFAFDNAWIGPTGRIILGIIGGLAMLGLGYYWRKKYPILTQVLSGGGIAILYLSIFAAFAIYDLMHIYVAVAFLLLISIASAALALYYDSMALAIIGIIGAFFAPFILGAFVDREAFGGTGGSGYAVQFLVYIIIVDIGVLILSTFRNWRWFTLLAIVCTLIAYGAWYGEFESTIGLATAEIGLTVIFLVFVGATTLFHIVWRRTPRVFDYALMIINAAAYFGISLGLMWGDLRAWLGGFIILLALFYGFVSYAALRSSTENARLSLFSLAMALVFITAAIPVQLGDSAWTTIVWAVEFVALIWFSFRLNMPFLRYYGFALFIVMVIRLLVFDTTVDLRDFQPIINVRFAAYLVGIGATFLVIYILWRKRESFPEWHIPASTLAVIASFLTLWIFSFEVWHGFSGAIREAERQARVGLLNAQNLSLTAVWAVCAVDALVIGIAKRWRYVRLGALIFLVVPIGKVFVYDVFKLEMAYRIGAFVGLGVLLLLSAYLYQRYSHIIKGVFIEK